jgi:hypothetical protein
MYAEFNQDLLKGATGEEIFETRYLKPLQDKGYEYKDVSSDPYYRKRDIDFVMSGKFNATFEIKNNYKDDEYLFIEEYGNVDEEYGPMKKGWWYYTKANYLVFVSKQTHTLVILSMNAKTRQLYEEMKDGFTLQKNLVSINRTNGGQWQSAFRRIPLYIFEGQYKIIKFN